MKERIFILSPDDNAPIGGVKQLYRQVDVLVKHGLYARVLHRKKGYHCTWFENNTPVISWSEFEWTDDDIIVLPEIYGPGMTKTLVVDKHRTLFSPSRFWQEELRPKMRKVIFNQNGYHTFARYGFSGSGRETPYLDPMVVATIVVSEDSREFVKAVFPEHNVLRVHNAINPSLFSYVENKKKQICFMPRKHRDEVEQVINIAKFHGALEGYSLHPIEHASEREVARIMSESLIFLSFGYPEGLSLPPLEAMATGCIAIGYHGGGAKEFLLPEHSFPIEAANTRGFASTVETVLQQYNTNPSELDQMRRAASEYVRNHYMPHHEEEDICNAWSNILGRNIE